MGCKDRPFPDVTAYRVDEAVELLNRHGINCYIKSSRRKERTPCNSNSTKNELQCVPQRYRVIKQIAKDPNLLELFVAMEAGYEQR